MNTAITTSKMPAWFWVATTVGLAWNAFGAVQFVQSLRATIDSLVAGGLTPQQAAVITSYPAWMTVAFAVGVFGGLLGCLLLLLRRKLAVPVFALSLVGYIALYIGDITEGVFAAMGTPQVVVLSVVVAIAAALLWLARAFSARQALR